MWPTPLRLLLLSPPRCTDRAALSAVVAGQTVLVTGASSGIGEATARLLAQAGAEVLLLARREAELQRVAQDIRAEGGRCAVMVLDLSRPEQVQAGVAAVRAAYPQLHAIVSNAGRSVRRGVLDAPEKRDLARLLAVNFTGPAELILGLLPSLLAAGGGQIVNVSTVSAGPPGAPRWAAYQGSKAGFDLWLHSVGAELRGQGVHVSSVYLPLVRTPMSAPTRAYRWWPALSAAEAAQSVAFALVRRRLRVAPWWWRGQVVAALLWPDALHRALAWAEVQTRPRRRG